MTSSLLHSLLERYAWSGGSRADFTLPGAGVHYPPHLEIEPLHLQISLHVDLDEATLRGRAVHTLAGRAGAKDLVLHAVAFDSVEVSCDQPIAWTYDGKAIRVHWEQEFAEDEKRVLVVDYVVCEPRAGLYFSKPDAHYPDRARYAATDNETEKARHWLPTIDLPSVRPTLEFHLRAEAGLVSLANGRLVGETLHDDGTRTTEWRLDARCPSYLTCFVVGDLVSFKDESLGELPIEYFATRERTPEDLQRSFGRTGEMLTWLQGKLGLEFPYPKYFQFALPGFGGAMENISLVSWDDVFVMDERMATELTWLVDQVNIHEMAHSYFGDLIVCRDFAHAWLKESWATYIEMCWLEHKRGREEADYDFYACSQLYIDEADSRYIRPLVTREFNTSWQMYDRHLYPGGAARLHTLRKELGDETFWKGVRAYVSKYASKLVETDDFRKEMEAASGRSLGRFFDQWIHSPGYPSFKVTFAHDVEQGVGNFTVEQTQESKEKGVPLFEVHVELGWTTEEGTFTRRVHLEHAKEQFSFKMVKPTMVRFDPNATLLHKLEFDPGEEALTAQLSASDVGGRIHAAQMLIKTGKAKNIKRVREAYEQETFWGVKVEIAGALGGAQTQSALTALCALVGSETDPMVMGSVFKAAGRYRDPNIALALEQRLNDTLPYRAQMSAFESLGLQRESAPLERLQAAARVDGFGGHAQSGALRGLGETRQQAALQTLVESLRYGATSNRARPAAATGLGALAKSVRRSERERIIEVLIDHLRDPDERVAAACAAALASADAGSSIEALEGYGSGLSHQQRVAVEGLIARIRSAAKPQDAATQKQVEELSAKVRKLGEQIEELEAKLSLGK